MTDAEIIQMFWRREETAITETQTRYGAYCTHIAINILSDREDAEECVSDTWLQAWNTIPPQKPRSLRAYLGRIVRNLSLNRWNHDHAQKRYSGMEQLLSELEDCIPAPDTAQRKLETAALSEIISDWLETLPRNDRVLFVRRYWYGDTLQELAGRTGVSASKLAQRMLRLRKGLKAALEHEEVSLE